MRLLEKEGMQGIYIIVILLIICLFFKIYIVSILVFLFLLYWLYIFSHKMVNPRYPDGIISPINGIVKSIDHKNNYTEIVIKARNNARIYAPTDLSIQNIEKKHGYIFFRYNKKYDNFYPQETIDSNVIINEKTFHLSLVMKPLVFKVCRFNPASNDILFLDKIGFMNFGVLKMTIFYDNLDDFNNNLALNVVEGSKVKGGITTIFAKKASAE